MTLEPEINGSAAGLNSEFQSKTLLSLPVTSVQSSETSHSHDSVSPDLFLYFLNSTSLLFEVSSNERRYSETSVCSCNNVRVTQTHTLTVQWFLFTVPLKQRLTPACCSLCETEKICLIHMHVCEELDWRFKKGHVTL